MKDRIHGGRDQGFRRGWQHDAGPGGHMPPQPRRRRQAGHRAGPRAPHGLHPASDAQGADASVDHGDGRAARRRHHAGHTHPAARRHPPGGARGMCVGLRGAGPRRGVATAERRSGPVGTPQSPIGAARGRDIRPPGRRRPRADRRQRPFAPDPRHGDRPGDLRRRANHPKRPRRRAGEPLRHAARQLRRARHNQRRRSRRGDGGDQGAGPAIDRADATAEHVRGEAGGGRAG